MTAEGDARWQRCWRGHWRFARDRVHRRIAIAIAVLLLDAACTTANPLMKFFFDDVPEPGEERVAQAVVRKPRRPAYKPPPPPVQFVAVPDLPPAIDWKARYAALPRDPGGAVAWTRSLTEKLITPKAGIADDAKDDEPTDMDVEISTSGQPEFKAVFPHRQHTMWMGCPACHTGIFAMEKGQAKMTMAGMAEGKYCGACHGKVAVPELSTCPACHTAMPK